MRYWWVNQNQTHKFEVRGGFLWSPKTTSDGRRNYFYDTMAELGPGDVVFSFFRTKIQAIGIVQGAAVTAPKPDFGGAGESWDSVGWLAEVEFTDVANPFRPKDVIEEIRVLLRPKYAPLRPSGDGNENLYLTEIDPELAQRLVHYANVDLDQLAHDLGPISGELLADESLATLQDAPRGLVVDLQVAQLVLARRGQGIFKHNVRLIESRCRLTGVSSPRHLRASHIKPWSESSDHEKIDGSNGLLLSPHVDHLFDRGFITFRRNGEIIHSSKLEADVLRRWALDRVSTTDPFSPTQAAYLEYHQDAVFSP